MKTFYLSLLLLFSVCLVKAQECNLEETKNRREQVNSIKKPLNYVVQITMKRGKKYNGTAFFIHPRVLLTAGHNLRKRPQFIFTRVKSITLRVGAINPNNYIIKKKYRTTQNGNIYTRCTFNRKYSIYEDYGIIILPDEELYNQIGGTFKLTLFNSEVLTGRDINLAGYPGDKEFCTLWHDKTSNFFEYVNSKDNPEQLEYLKYDFFTRTGVSGAPVWYSDKGENYVFAIHTYGNNNDDKKCNTATLITTEVYNDIINFCMKKGIDLTK
ncbi:MAG: trypsin-like serine protease [Marinifilum sp.]|jgi:V8-like Glu-specific endopeptidase|nr:trypsin-like serine protease [Marinifilum sp.]